MLTAEELLEEVVCVMHTLSKDHLVSIREFLSMIEKIDVSRKTRLSLLTCIMNYLEREEIGELEDGGMTELLLLKDKVTEITKSTKNEPGQKDKLSFSS